MPSAKDLVVKPISAQDANRIIRALHYSGKVVNNSQVHFGVFLDGRCGGALSFGPSLDKRKMIGLVEGTLWNEFLELNRMALADWLPRNGESRAIAVAMRLLKKAYPWLKWVVSFADATQCGDGTIYRAAGFVLTGIKVNNQLWQAPETDARFSRVSLTDNRSHKEQARATALSRGDATKGKNITSQMLRGVDKPGPASREGEGFTGGGSSMRRYVEAGFTPLPGFQLRYVYFLDPTARDRLTVQIIPFDEIERRGAGMYRGKPRAGSIDADASAIHAEEGGSSPTPALQNAVTVAV